jgi:hypothetical protein
MRGEEVQCEVESPPSVNPKEDTVHNTAKRLELTRQRLAREMEMNAKDESERQLLQELEKCRRQALRAELRRSRPHRRLGRWMFDRHADDIEHAALILLIVWVLLLGPIFLH